MLIISHTFPPDMGGASSRAWNMAKALTKQGHRVRVIAARSYYPHGRVSPQHRNKFLYRERLEGIDILRVWVPALATFGLGRRLTIYFVFMLSYSLGLLILGRQKFDIVHYSSPYALSFFSLPACLFGKMKGTMVLLDVHDLWPQVILEAGMIRSGVAEKILFIGTWITSRLSDYVTPISDSMARGLVSSGVPERKIRPLELAVDTDFFRPVDPGSLRGTIATGFLVEYSGLLGRKFDFDTLLTAARRVGETQQAVTFLIRGDGEMKNHVMNLARGLNSVVIRTDLVSSEEVVRYLNLADVLVCPMNNSDEDAAGIPTKIIEYLAVGKPVVCSARGDTEKVIRDGDAGVVVAPGDPDALCRAILDLYADRTLAEEKGRHARQLAEDRFSLESLSIAVANLYYEFMAT